MSDQDRESLKDTVKRLRADRGMTQEDLAEATGMSQEWVAKIESGEIMQPRSATMTKLAKALRTDLAELILSANTSISRASAKKIAEQMKSDDGPPPSIDPSDPLYNVVFSGLRKLSREDLADLRRIVLKMTEGEP